MIKDEHLDKESVYLKNIECWIEPLPIKANINNVFIRTKGIKDVWWISYMFPIDLLILNFIFVADLGGLGSLHLVRWCITHICIL